jgi:hypothetical protein
VVLLTNKTPQERLIPPSHRQCNLKKAFAILLH